MSATTPPATTTGTSAELSNARARFIEAWGDMASAWGISKTMAQIYALLYASSQPLDTDDIMATLDISRGNANMNLRKLLEWGLVLKVDKHDKDTRKDLFEAEKDVWTMTARIIRERNDKEIAPVSRHLSVIAASLDKDADGKRRALTDEEAAFKKNIQEMSDFMGLFNTVLQTMLPLLENKNRSQIQALLKLLRPNA